MRLFAIDTKKNLKKGKKNGENKNKIIKDLSIQMEEETIKDISISCGKYAVLLKYVISRNVDFEDIIEAICR